MSSLPIYILLLNLIKRLFKGTAHPYMSPGERERIAEDIDFAEVMLERLRELEE